MGRRTALACIPLLAICACSGPARQQYNAVYGTGPRQLVVATGSPGELGLLKTIAEAFAKQEHAKVCWRKAGSGRSLQLLHEREVDVAMVHAPAAEEKAVKEGWARARTLIGSNEFFIVGPTDDPAGIRTAKTAAEAYTKIAASRATFLSRADNSGTHKREIAIWKQAGVAPQGDWYVKTGDFMMATLKRANAEKGYFMTDSSTWVVGRNDTPRLGLLFRGDPILVNVYHALCQPPGATPGAALGERFVSFLASEQAQAALRSFGKERYGEPLYNDANHSKQYE